MSGFEKRCVSLLASIAALVINIGEVQSQGNSPGPHPIDPSQQTGPQFGELPDDLPPANAGALEGGETGEPRDASVENVLQPEEQREDGTFNVPSNGPPSPLFGAEPFTQQMLRFEEFGTDQLKLGRRNKPKGWQPLPAPADAKSVPDGVLLEEFLTQAIWPVPTRLANIWNRNPWEFDIEDYLGRNLSHPPAEGRPPGQGRRPGD